MTTVPASAGVPAARAGEARPAVAWGPVGAAVLVLAVLLTATSTRYGYHRDELYFRMLDPAWGYVDQPPLTPWIARTGTDLFGDTLLVMRVPATLAHVAAVVVVALVARELGGRAGAQALAAWGYGTAAIPLAFGHTFLTASLDLVVWPAVLLCAIRGVRRDPRWWLVAGLVTGVALYNKLLVVALLGGILVGLLVAWPRRAAQDRTRWPLATPWPWAGAAVALLVGLPNLVHQATHGWPQLAMGAALGENNAAEVRSELWLFQLLTLGPPLVVVWLVGIVWLWRRLPTLRFLVVAYPVLLAFTYAAGSQVYYATGLLAVLFAAGCVPVAGWARTAWRRATVTALVVLNGASCVLISLPVVPVGELAETPVADINSSAQDAVGWPEYVRQVAAVHAALPPADRERAVVLTQNYGEAGAVDRFGPELGLPPAYSGHNELWEYGPPPRTATVALVLTEAPGAWGTRFDSCTQRARLDNGVGVDNEEQGVAVLVCRDPVGGWDAVWPGLRHLD
ncbi:glycosyltransferase family 39 protein [Promicromonospora thailandica]|uniref:Dolichyl-phosphate-mannose-protein mannosyltransferase n=1 Tax=Promicromonospora thailandica TaxID=765201 RepID=A0A9X2G0T9_9MICO|nr:glycosyltransferase family 39 protein [Promicromonospora thailandica]MCP2264940.1 Dolichyl-phosphate-mannose-protein mannosyltransferase [Promicromonospora thailandica]